MQHNHHHEQHVNSSRSIQDIVIGMADGLTVPFALSAGLSGALISNHIIVTAGIAEIIAGSIAMGLGGYLSGKTEQNHYTNELKREYEEVELYPEKETEEVMEVFAEYGFSENSQKILASEIVKDKDKWVAFMMKFELGLEEPDANRATKSALTIGVSYIIGGMLPLIPYMFCNDAKTGLMYSAGITLVALFIFGYFKSKVTGQPPIKGAFTVMLIGAIASAVAFFVAKLVSG
jgi:vacuolar iron transporter family protein